MTSTSMRGVDVATITPIPYREAITMAAVEHRRVADLLAALPADAWSRPTDCARWDVKALALHLLGSLDGQASVREFIHQWRHGRPLTAEIGGVHWVDGMNELQIRERAHLSPPDIVRRIRETAPRAEHARRRIPPPVRALRVLELGPPVGRVRVDYLTGMGLTRDAWMHRIDLCRAVNQTPALTPEHDGRLIADIVAEWARLHGEPFTLILTGPAGGQYRQGTDGPTHEVDAVQLCRILSGRAHGEGVLRHPLPL